MLVLAGVLLVLIPMAAILYPFLRKQQAGSVIAEDSSAYAELSRRWDTAVDGLRNSELERAIGNLGEDDYRWLREQYMTEAAVVLKAMELEEQQEQDLLAGIELEVRKAREGALGGNGVDGATRARSVQEPGDE